MMRLLLAAPVLVLLIVFALSNQQVVQLGLWPTDIMVDVPLSVAVLVAAGVFFIAGALMTWSASIAMYTRARRAERALRQLEAQVQSLKTRPVTGTVMARPEPARNNARMVGTSASQPAMALPPPGN